MSPVKIIKIALALYIATVQTVEHNYFGKLELPNGFVPLCD